MFDIAVIGAGSAGAVIAARASEDPNRNVVLIEAGPDYPVLADTPEDLINGHDNSYRDHDWGLEHLPSSGGRNTPFPRGRVTGGSSAVNTTIALRGVPEDYDHWAELGNPEWAWERVLPAFRRLERDLDFGNDAWHGDAGPITIRRYPPSELVPVQEAFVAAGSALGWPDCPDANDPFGWGASATPLNKLGRLRISTAIGYLAPARLRPNLTVTANTSVRRLVVEGGRVSAAEVESDGEVATVRAKLFVLSSGAVHSPALLMRSGIGPRAQLESLGIDVVADVSGVGSELADHPAALVVCRAKDPAMADRGLPLMQAIYRYTAEGSDLRNDLAIEQLTFAGRIGADACFAVAAVLQGSFGRGSIRLTSADPSAAPVIESCFGQDERDVARLARCLEDAVEVVHTPPLSDLVDEVTFPRLPLTSEGAIEICRQHVGSGYHPCGSARMGPPSDRTTVVDQFGRCHAVDGLVVADASIMPTVPRANTNLTAIMIGEMVGEWVRTRPQLYGL